MKMVVIHPLSEPIPEEQQQETGRLYLLLLHASGVKVDGVRVEFQED